MRCCVPRCKNDSRRSSKSQGITFHAFPTTPSLRMAWLKALSKEDWHPKDRSAICSEHFLNDDLYVTKNGLRKVRAGAVPLISQDYSANYEFGSLASLQACRMCLVMNQRLFSIKHYNLGAPFERFTGLSLNEDDRLPQKLCSECSRRLLNADAFKSRTLRAHMLMVEILNKQNVLSSETLKSIDRENHQLSSPLQPSYKTDHYDVEIEHKVTVQTNPEYPQPLEIEIDIKNENIFADEIKDYDEAQNDFAPETDDENDANFVAPKPDDSESDDSLPLEVARKKKKKQKSKESVKKVRKKEAKQTEPKIDRRRKPFLNQDLNETLFTVTNLSVDEQIAEIQKRQESDNYKHSVFKCTECYKGFLDQDAYNGHMTRHTNECGDHQCEICKTHFKHSHALRKHITAHHTQRFSCNQCPYVTTHSFYRRHLLSLSRETERPHSYYEKSTRDVTCQRDCMKNYHRQTARLHERWHKGTRYRCPHCPEEFVKFTTYMGHVRIKHPSDFVCEICGYSFVSAKGIELHKKLKHRRERGPVPSDGPFCEQCNVRFASVEAHRKHLSVSARHTTKETREANKANKGRRTREIRDRDKTKKDEEIDDNDESRRVYPSQLRKAEGPIPCEQCGLQLEDSRAYHGHFRRMHPDKNRTKYPSMKSPCMCELCGRIFQSYALLKDHTWVHTGERPFQCGECGKSFRMKQRLVAHRRVHAPVKASYVCNVCGKPFSTHSNRQRHMFIHTGLKPFKCEMCGKGFKHASEKRAHVTYVHLKKPWPKRSRGKRSGRQGSLPPDASASDMEMQPVWPACEPKLTDINILDDKPIYYNLKI